MEGWMFETPYGCILIKQNYIISKGFQIIFSPFQHHVLFCFVLVVRVKILRFWFGLLILTLELVEILMVQK